MRRELDFASADPQGRRAVGVLVEGEIDSLALEMLDSV